MIGNFLDARMMDLFRNVIGPENVIEKLTQTDGL